MKKVLKYLLYTLLILIVIFFAMGMLKPTIEYGHEITVNKPLKESWAVAMDDAKFPQWLDGFKSMELVSGEKMKVGAKSKVIVDPGDGQEDFEMIETLESIKEFDHVTMHFDSEMMDFDQTMSFKETEGKTIIKTESAVSAKGIVMRSMFAVMETLGGAFQKQEEKNIDALKKVIEENTTDYYPVEIRDSTRIE